MRILPAPLLALTASLLLLTTGCYYPTENRPVYGTETRPEANVPTSLVIVIEGECTEEEYRTRRLEIVNYLIERGYITQESDLISDPANAVRVIRAIVSNGGFTLSVFNQSDSVESVPDLEMTDILYPADPYFIFGFAYLYEIGPRRLPPRPRDYQPHPRPPHSGRPPGYHDYDRDRHWSRSGQPNHGNNNSGNPPLNRRPRDGDRPRPERGNRPTGNTPDLQPGDSVQPIPATPPPGTQRPNRPRDADRPTSPGDSRPPSSQPSRRHGDHAQPNPDNQTNPPTPDNPPRQTDRSRPDPTTPPPASTPGQKPDYRHGPSQPGNRPKLPPDPVAPRNPDQPRPDRNGNGQPAPTTPPRGADRPTSPGTSHPPSNPPPPQYRPPEPTRSTPAPEKPAPAPKERPPDDREQNGVQR